MNEWQQLRRCLPRLRQQQHLRSSVLLEVCRTMRKCCAPPSRYPNLSKASTRAFSTKERLATRQPVGASSLSFNDSSRSGFYYYRCVFTKTTGPLGTTAARGGIPSGILFQLSRAMSALSVGTAPGGTAATNVVSSIQKLPASKARALAAVAQMTTTSDHEQNFQTAEALVKRAKKENASMVFFPEAFAFLGNHFTETVAQAEPIFPGDFCDTTRTGARNDNNGDIPALPEPEDLFTDGPVASSASTSTGKARSSSLPDRRWLPRYLQLAKEHEIWISFGGYHEQAATDEERDDEKAAAAEQGIVVTSDGKSKTVSGSSDTSQIVPIRVFNSHLIVNSEGKIVARYRKIHLFDVSIPNGPVLMESRYTQPGKFEKDNLLVVPSPVGNLGLTTCYDLRFPELYTVLREELNAEVMLVPSAFTVPTGQAHWHVLLRARAIETQCFVLAAAQCGKHNEKRASYGHALVVSPWGEVLADCGGERERKENENVENKETSNTTLVVPPVSVFAFESKLALVEIDTHECDKIREKIPVFIHRDTAGIYARRKDIFEPRSA
ncbi:unnamed protein product [Amoebophrya sp. A120]|nr:unnamed protein product [Amoebophrya sp. A120]|eukprot:GSA120T00023327001.1